MEATSSIEGKEVTDSIPSILKQTIWDAGIYNFGAIESEKVAYFNPTIIERPDGEWLLVRRSKWVPHLRFGMNDVIAIQLINNKPGRVIKCKVPITAKNEQVEDPRAIYYNGKTYMSACNFIWYGSSWTGAHQILCVLNENFECVERHDPAFGSNGHGIGLNKGNEKNWLWFFTEGRPHMIYMATPKHFVVRFGQGLQPVQEFKTEWNFEIWQHGKQQDNTPKIGGGTPPVMVNNMWWTFFHSSVKLENGKRRYHMGAYAFESRAPFRIVRCTTEPILSGSKYDPWFENKPPCIFPGGALYKDQKWKVVFGVNDLKCGWIEIPHRDLLDMTIRL